MTEAKLASLLCGSAMPFQNFCKALFTKLDQSNFTSRLFHRQSPRYQTVHQSNIRLCHDSATPQHVQTLQTKEAKGRPSTVLAQTDRTKAKLLQLSSMTIYDYIYIIYVCVNLFQAPSKNCTQIAPPMQNGRILQGTPLHPPSIQVDSRFSNPSANLTNQCNRRLVSISS